MAGGRRRFIVRRFVIRQRLVLWRFVVRQRFVLTRQRLVIVRKNIRFILEQRLVLGRQHIIGRKLGIVVGRNAFEYAHDFGSCCRRKDLQCRGRYDRRKIYRGACNGRRGYP